MHYKGKGEHNVLQLEELCNFYKEEISKLKHLRATYLTTLTKVEAHLKADVNFGFVNQKQPKLEALIEVVENELNEQNIKNKE